MNWLLEDRRTGRWVVAQVPNAPLLVWGATALLQWLWHPSGTVGTVLTVVGTLALGVWALDEVARGVNPFRRMVGAVVLAFLVGRWVVNENVF